MKRFSIFLTLLVIVSVSLAQLPPGFPNIPGASGQDGDAGANNGVVETEDGFDLVFINAPIQDILSAYETLTEKTLILDTAVTAQQMTLTLNSRGKVTRAAAIRMIESLLLLNNFTLVPGVDNTIKVLSSQKQPTTQGLPFYTDVSQLPEGDQVISFYLPLQYVETADALAIIQSSLQPNPYGKIVEAANAQAIIISENAAYIKKALKIIELIDVPPAQLSTEFIQLQRADAEEVVEALKEIVDQYTGGQSGNRQQQQRQQRQPNTPPIPIPGLNQGGGASGGSATADLTQVLTSSQFYADPRTNRILVITRPLFFTQIKELILKFDDAVTLVDPYVRKLNYVRAQEILPVLADLLKSGGDTEVELSQGQGGQGGTGGGGNTGGGNRGGGSGINSPNLLGDPDEDTAPDSAIVGKTKLVADKRNNSIIVFGPPEDIEKSKVLIDELDQKAPQIYINAVIASYDVSDDMDFSFNIFQNLINSGDNQIAGVSRGTASPFIEPATLTNGGAFDTGAAALSGLSIYGTIGSALDYAVEALESTGNLTVLSRPSLFTENNKKATILSGERVAVPTSTLTNASTGAGDDATFRTNIDFEEVVLKLEVIPLITPDGEISLEIAQINDSLGEVTIIDDNPIRNILTQEIVTTVTIPDGAVVALGGLVAEDESRNQSGVPLLSRIPILGYLFSGVQKERGRSELVVLVQPNIIRTNEELAERAERIRTENKVGPAAFTIVDEKQYSPRSKEDLDKEKYRYLGTKESNSAIPGQNEINPSESESAPKTKSTSTKSNRQVQESVSGKGSTSSKSNRQVQESVSSGTQESDPFEAALKEEARKEELISVDELMKRSVVE
ncbi:MAG: secretin N-terminal domain-containing protein [Verrucomicrobiota bacterium]